MEMATHRLIDSVWTVAYTVGDDGRATIHGYGRDCGTGYREERRLDRCRLVEGPGRTVTELVIQPNVDAFRHSAVPDGKGAVTYEVSNPGHVFGYGAPPDAAVS